jgi:hypothetical protein
MAGRALLIHEYNDERPTLNERNSEVSPDKYDAPSYTMYSSSLSSMHLMMPSGSSALILAWLDTLDIRDVYEEDDVVEFEPEIANEAEPELAEPTELVLFVLARW